MTNVVSAGQPRKAADRGVIGWMLFDWAAQPFFTVVTTFIFGPYFVSRMTSDPVSAQASWSNMATISSIIIALLAPVLGSIADRSGSRKPWIAFFAVAKIISLCLLWTAAPGSPVIIPLILMIVASISAEFSIVFNDSMMPRLVSSEDVGRISNIAWGMGYLGGIIVLIGIVLFIAANPDTGLTLLGQRPLFGLDPVTGEDARITGPLSAMWYFIFILPMFFFTPDAKRGLPLGQAVRSGFGDLKATLHELKTRPAITRFLIARMIYQDGVNGLLILGGVFAAGMFGWSTMEIGVYGIILNVVAIGGCIGAGYIDRGFGSKFTVVMSLVLLLIATVGIISTGPGFTLFGALEFNDTGSVGLFSTAAEKAYIFFGTLVGLAFGPVQASSRSYLARSVSIEEAGRYFGIYALSGRATSFMATLSFSILTYWSGSARVGMASMIFYLAVGLFILARTPYPASDADRSI